MNPSRVTPGAEHKANVLTSAYMAVSLTKTEITGAFPNQAQVKCPRCDQTYRLSYSDDEWNRVRDWSRVAERALREDHKHRHELASLGLRWNPVRGR